MFSRKTATVLSTSVFTPQCEELLIILDGEKHKALNFPELTGTARPGDRVVVNTTAVDLGLGSGGYHFVYLNLESTDFTTAGKGHIMKLRYTPMQMRVLAVEEEASAHHAVMAGAWTLDGMPVVSAELHSMLAPFVLSLKRENPGIRLAYLMTDGGALPAFFSRTAAILKERDYLCGVITAGHAFGGDMEAVTVYSGLLAARHVLKADAVFVGMGPGVAGTGTPFGFSGIEMGENVNRTHVLGGRPVSLPRISFADRRARHNGFSHHTLTSLATVALASADLPLPVLPPAEHAVLSGQISHFRLDSRHRVTEYGGLSLDHLEEDRELCKTMGRSLREDSAFFLAAVAAARHTSILAGQPSVEALA